VYVLYVCTRASVSAGLTLTSDHAEPENISLSYYQTKDSPSNDMTDDNSRGRRLKSSFKNERDRVRECVARRTCTYEATSTVDTNDDGGGRAEYITIAAKLQRPVLLARERPRAPQNHNTTPYKIQYDAAAGRHLPVTATTSSSRHPRS